MTDVLVATSRDAPAELVTPLRAALAARGLEVKVLDLGRIGQTGSRLGRVVQALLGEDEAGRLLRELAQEKPRAAVALDPGALAALILARERRVSQTAAVGVVPDLAPGKRWAVDADRLIAIDDEAAVALSDHGVDGARVLVGGPIVPQALHEAAGKARAELRKELKIPAEAPVLLFDTRGVSLEELAQLTLQLSLLARPVYTLFDAADGEGTAAQLRRQVPTLGLKGKMFGETENARRLWRSADMILARPTARAIHAARALGAFFIALEPQGEDQLAEARALLARGLGVAADRIVFLSSALDPLVGKRPPAPVGIDGAGVAADLIADVVAHHEEVLAETFAARAEEAASEASAAEVEDLGGGDVEDFGAAASPGPRTSSSSPWSGKQERLRKELDESRAEAERWEERRRLAERKGDRALVEQAAREADRKRARMHQALTELQRMAGAPEPPPREDPLAAFKRQVSQSAPSSSSSSSSSSAGPRSVDDELTALKNRMKKGPR